MDKISMAPVSHLRFFFSHVPIPPRLSATLLLPIHRTARVTWVMAMAACELAIA